MADVLSQSQIDALLKSMASGGAPEPEASVPEEVEAKVDKKRKRQKKSSIINMTFIAQGSLPKIR